ncbi:MAG: peroxiredoxin [Bacteroidetes bacterium]|nr:peroxiredoxin [Bacteroidota bacterium]
MKKIVFLLIALAFSASIIYAQGTMENRIPMLGENAPAFTAESTNGTLHFPKDFGKNWKIIFSHPMDFTPVCSSELLELANMQQEFEKLGVSIIVVSTDNLESHNNWKKSLETLSYKKRETASIKFPLVDDYSRTIARAYGMIHSSTNETKNVRGVFIIDPENKIRAVSFYPMEVGRNIEEIKRMVIAMQTVKTNTVMTPANWQPGGDVLIPFNKNGGSDNANAAKNDPKQYEISWYMIFKKLD